MKNTASKNEKPSVEASYLKLCRGGCGRTAIRRKGPLAWCGTCWWARQACLAARVQTLADLAKVSA